MAVTKLHIEALDILADDLPGQKFKYLLAVIQIVRKPPANRYSNFRFGNTKFFAISYHAFSQYASQISIWDQFTSSVIIF